MVDWVAARWMARLWALCATLLLLTRVSAAEDGTLHLSAVAVLGQDVPSGSGWFSCAVRLENRADTQLEGTVELTSEIPWTSGSAIVLTRAPFSLAGKGKVALELPTHGFDSSSPSLSVVARGEAGQELAKIELPEPRMAEPLLFDFNPTQTIGTGIRGKKVAVAGARLRGTYTAPMAAVGNPASNPATGDPVLPARAAGYAAVTVALAKSEQLARLKGAELEALGNWVLGGGALAVVMSRPEDFRSPVLGSLVGAGFRQIAAPKELGEVAQFIIPDDSSSRSPYYGRGQSVRVAVELGPSADVAGRLVSYAGGGLRPSPWGASASYGLGEVHLLAFDPTREAEVADGWVQHKMLDLLRHAWERQATVAFGHGQQPLDSNRASEIRKLLDPNEGARWAIAVALLMLLVYAVLAGPVNFHLASKRGKPLRALVHLPIWSGATLLAIVGLGAVSKGVEGRARRVSLIEAGAGTTRASITRYRGFYASSAAEMFVRGSAVGSVLDVFGENEGKNRILMVDRDGVRLEQVRAKPWQTVVVREDTFVTTGGGVSLVQSGPDLVVKNLLGRDLRGVLVKAPGKEIRFFERLADGESIRHADGVNVAPAWGPATTPRRRALGARGVLAKHLDGAASGLSAAWAALEAVSGHETDWWPDDVPTVVAQIDGGEGLTRDSGLRLDSDRLLIRVVGFGGLP